MKEGWKYKNLGDVIDITMGQSPSSDTYNESEGLPFFQGNADFGKMHPNVRVYCNAPIRIADKKDILISVRAPIGAINIADRKCCIGRGLAALRGSNKYENRFLYYFLNASKEKLIAQGTGSTFKSIGKDTLKSLQVPVLTISEQERIVAELDLLSGIIDKQKAQLKELDTLAQSIFYDMFGNPYFNNKQWDVQQLGDVCSFSQGIQVDVSEQITEPREGWNRFLRIVDYTSDNTDIRYVHINNQQYWIDKDDIAMVRYGSVGVVGINKTGILANNLFKINYHRHQFDKHFLFYFFNTDYFLDYISKVAFGATMPALSFKVMKSLKIFIPDISLQRLFAEKIVAIESQKETINRSIAESQKLFDYTMDKYFS